MLFYCLLRLQLLPHRIRLPGKSLNHERTHGETDVLRDNRIFSIFKTGQEIYGRFDEQFEAKAGLLFGVNGPLR